MKIRIIEDPDLEEDIIIHCRVMTPEIQKFVDQSSTMSIQASSRGSDVNVDLNNVLFFETEGDAVYVHFYNQAGNSVIDGSILALEAIIANIALTPLKWSIGEASETAPQITQLNDRLVALKQRKTNNKVPMILKSDRKTWCDFDKVFGAEYK